MKHRRHGFGKRGGLHHGTAGKSFPLGARVFAQGVNFSLYSKNAASVELLLFDHADDRYPAQTIRLDPKKNRTRHYWHVFIPDLKPGQIYAYRVEGPYQPARGLLYDPEKILLDPYGRALAVPPGFSRKAASFPGPNTGAAMKSVVADPRTYDWGSDAPLRIPFSETVIYELHVGGFTKHPNSGLEPRTQGTYAGLIEKIPYLKDLGITAVELMPVFQFDPQDAPLGKVNYWGYAPVSFFVPHQAYSSHRAPLGILDEFRDMVKMFHRSGIEVLLDVVYNHTAEGRANGPTYAFRGLQNDVYYLLDKKTGGYADYTGTGNTLNTNNPVVRRMILDSLHYWVQEMHVDGFRFDLASIFSRGESGEVLASPPVLWDIDSDPVLCGTKLIAEAWDAGGLYQVGTFLGDHWKEWNGIFRDDVRRFIRGDAGYAERMSKRLLGSPDVYGHKPGPSGQNINFVTCHDGFTLNDLVSYQEKHNQANGENNRDGNDLNFSWNCGAEGPSSEPGIETLRIQQIKNFLLVNLFSVGTPMILMGDEARRTQLGNNNAYCQDSELAWMDWELVRKNGDLLRFVKKLIRARLNKNPAFLGGLGVPQVLREAEIQWHGIRLGKPDFALHSRSLAFTAQMWEGVFLLHFILNAYWEPLDFELPVFGSQEKSGWQRWIDTSLASPEDFLDWNRMAPVAGTSYRAAPRSSSVLFYRLGG